MKRTLLTAAALLALCAANPALADDAQAGPVKTAFSQAVKTIKGWFGGQEQQAADAARQTTAFADDEPLMAPTPLDPTLVEPAAGAAGEDDLIQVPPQYIAPLSENNAAKPRATSFDNNPATAAFKDAPTPEEMAGIAPAAGEGTQPALPEGTDCDAVLKAAESAEEGDLPDTALIEACEIPKDPSTEPAQPAFEMQPMPQALPATQPAAGEPPIGGAVMPGEENKNAADAPKTDVEAPPAD